MTITVTPTGAALGAFITDFDAASISPAEAKALNDAFLKYHVLVLRDQLINDAQQVTFGQCFGEIEKARYKSPLTDRDDIMVISNIREDGKVLGQLPDGEMSFHFDRIHQPKPCRGAALRCIETPDDGGDTCFANMVMAYDTLPDATKRRIEGKVAVNSFTYTATSRDQKDGNGPRATHPVVRTIPETGRKALYLCRLMTDHIEGLSDAESETLINELCDHIEQPRFIYQHKWKVGDILVWDNRCTCHARTDFPESQRRLMKRVTIGDNALPMH
jgi:taurine dioxygenase